MFAVIYRGYIKPGRESEYQQAWNQVARYFVKERGALGSCLHRTRDGLYLAYSRWPDQATRDASWPQANDTVGALPKEILHAISTIKDCIDKDREMPDICLDVVDDLFLSNHGQQLMRLRRDTGQSL